MGIVIAKDAKSVFWKRKCKLTFLCIGGDGFISRKGEKLNLGPENCKVIEIFFFLKFLKTPWKF